MGGNEKAEGKVRWPWEAKLDTHTFIRRLTKESEIMLLGQRCPQSNKCFLGETKASGV